MKKNFICSKKSVRTFKLKIEPYFLSHAERGKTFWIREFLAGMRLFAGPRGASILAEGEGFEPSEPFRVQHISSVLHSTALPPLQNNALRIILQWQSSRTSSSTSLRSEIRQPRCPISALPPIQNNELRIIVK